MIFRGGFDCDEVRVTITITPVKTFLIKISITASTKLGEKDSDVTVFC